MCVACVYVIIVLNVVLHLSDGGMLSYKMRELDSGGCLGSTQSPRNAQCYIDRRAAGGSALLHAAALPARCPLPAAPSLHHIRIDYIAAKY